MRKKMIGKSLLFTALLAVLLAALSPIFVYKTEHRAKLEEGLYLSDDQYDVIFMGSSHMNGGLDPNVIWNQQGIPSFNYATGGQSLDVTYYLLKEVLDAQKPSCRCGPVLSRHDNPIWRIRVNQQHGGQYAIFRE